MSQLVRKYAVKWRRLWLPRRLKHMAVCSRHLQLRRTEPGGGGEILWRGRAVGRLLGMNSLRNQQAGDCFIVGAGPSLAPIDLRLVADWPLVGVNGTIVKFRQDGVVPTIYLINDPDFYQHRFELVQEALASGATCFLPFVGLSIICERDPGLLAGVRVALLETINRRYYQPRLAPAECDARCAEDPDLVLHPTVRGQEGLVGFSRNLSKGMFGGQTVVYRGIQIAHHMGFRRVFLLGVDLGAQGNQVRFYETKEQARPSMLNLHYESYIRPSFEVLRTYCDRSGFEVYNCSLGSRLPDSLVPKISLDEAIARCRQAKAA